MPTHQVSTKFLCDPDLDDWPYSAMWLYTCLWINPEINGLTGVYPKPSDRILKVWTRFNDKELAANWKIITSPIKVKDRAALPAKIVTNVDGWLWVVGKANYGIFSIKQGLGAMASIKQVPTPLAKAFITKYRSRLANAGICNIRIGSDGEILWQCGADGRSYGGKRARGKKPPNVRPGNKGDPV